MGQAMTGEQTIQRLFYTTHEVATIFGVDNNTVRKMAKDGRLPFIKFGRSLRYPKQTIDATVRMVMQKIGQTEEMVKAINF